MSTLPLALTPGEPAGIGPDLTVMLAQQKRNYDVIAIADPDLLYARAQALDLPLELSLYSINKMDTSRLTREATCLNVLPVKLATSAKAGILNPENASYVLETLRCAAKGCLQGDFQAMVTAPLHKGVINDAGISFTGHTEFLAEYTKAQWPVMMLAAKSLRVALATTHLPLSEVSAAITKPVLRRVLNVLLTDLKQKFALTHPRVLVCGLNPHAGESGHLGREEIEIIEPVLKEFRAQGELLIGSLPADTLFTPRYLDNADAVLAMYHDQGLPVLKHVGFGHAVNITLGLPIIRTSVDHGTALDLAGTGKASMGSLLAALEQAAVLAHTHLGERTQ